jgi:hypothetical protein
MQVAKPTASGIAQCSSWCLELVSLAAVLLLLLLLLIVISQQSQVLVGCAARAWLVVKLIG